MSSQTERSAKRLGGKTSWIVPIAVVALAAIVIGLIIAMNREGTAIQDQATGQEQLEVEEVTDTAEIEESVVDDTQGAPTEVQNPSQPDLNTVERRDENDPLAVGAVDAPVVMVVFSDYQCSFCAKWSADTMPVMMEQVDAGNLRIEWRDVNIFGPASERASRAAYAAALQGAYTEYHDALFAGGSIRPESELSDDALVALAGDLGLDTERFVTDYNSPETTEATVANQTLGLELGVFSTPSFVLGGQPIVGAQPTEVFVDSLDGALASAGVAGR